MSSRKLKIYNSPKGQGPSKLKSSSPIRIEDIEVDKKIESVFELIDKLPNDLQRKLFTDIRSLNVSNASNRNLPLLNNEFAETYSYTRKLSKIKSKSPEKSPVKNLSKQITSVSAVIGDLKLKKIQEYSPVKKELDKIFSSKHLPNDLYEEASDNFDNFLFDTLEQVKEQYNLTDKQFETKKQEYNEMWNFLASNLEYDFGEVNTRGKIAKYDRLKSNQTKIKKCMKEVKEFDHAKDMDKVENYLKLNENSTYAEYVKSVKELPISAKAVVGI